MTDAEHDDEGLLREFALTRSAAAFERLVDRHWPRAFRLAHDCLHDAAAAEDLAQEVFFKLARASSRELELKGRFAPWFRTLVLNGVRDRVKLADRRKRHEERAASERPVAASERVAATLEAEDLRREVARLPLDVRVAVVLRYFEGRTHEDVARLLDCPPGTASSRIRRGLEQLREQLTGAGASVASLSALEALLAGVPSIKAPAAPATASLLPRARSVGLKLAVAGALLAAAILGTIVVVSPAADPAPVAALGAPDDAPADALAPGAGDDERGAPTTPANDGASDRAPSSTGALPPTTGAGGSAPASGSAASPTATSPRDEPAPVATAPADALRLQGRVLGAPAMTPLADAELFLLRRETIDGSAYWSGDGAPLARTDHAGEFALSSVSIAVGKTPPELTDVLLFARREGFRPFLRRLPVSALGERLDLVLEQGAAPRVHGRVVDTEGKPLAGLRVMIGFQLAGEATGLLLGEAAAPAQAVTRTGMAGVELRTDRDGRFLADGLLPVDAIVSIPDGQSHSAAAREVRAAPDPRELSIVAAASARLEVEVLDRSGAPCAAAVLALRAANGADTVRPTLVGAGGRSVLVVPADRYRLRVGLPGAWSATERADGVPDHDEVVQLAAGELRRVVVRPAAAHTLGTIGVLVQTRAGAPVTDHEVWLAAGDATSWNATLTRRTDAQGRVEFPELARGRYKLQAQGQLSHEEDAVVALEGSRAEATLVTVQRCTLRGVVRGPDGAPVPGAEVGAAPIGGGSVETTTTDDQGRFTIDGVPSEAHVTVEAAGFLDFDSMRTLDGQPLDLTLAIGRVLTVRGEAPAGVADGTIVEVTFRHGGSMSGKHVEVTEGQFEATFVGLSPRASGTVTVRVGQGAASSHSVRPGDELLEVGQVGAEAGFTVRARVVDPTGMLGGEHFASVTASRATSDDAPEYRGTLDRAGRLELRGLPGEPMVLFVDVSSGDMGDERSATAEVRFDPRSQPDLGVITLTLVEVPVSQMNALRVIVTDANGVLARAGFRDGDLIVGVGGVLFEDEKHAISLLMRLEVEGAIDCDVQRGASRLVVRLGAAALEPEQAGGRVEPCMR